MNKNPEPRKKLKTYKAE